MFPVTPSPRRGAFKRLSDLHQYAAGNIEGGGGSHHGIPIPPLYYKKPGEKEGNDAAIQTKQGTDSTFVYKTPEKQKIDHSAGIQGSSSPFTTKSQAFVPIDRPPLSRSTATPPISPLVGKRLPMSAAASPASSLASQALTEDMTLTPSTTTSYLQAASISPYPSSSQHRHSGASPSQRSAGRSPSPSLGSGAPLSPRKSPNKYYQQRSGAVVSPLSYSPSHHSNIPYSPGGSSIGSHSTTTIADDAARKQRVKTELCMHWSSGRVCPFGTHCTYAHGEAELVMTKLMDLQSAGLIEDAETYRTKPCLTWVATGSW